jgi:TolA-binding protein
MAGSVITAFAVVFKQLEKCCNLGQSKSVETDSLAPTSSTSDVDQSHVSVELVEWKSNTQFTKGPIAKAEADNELADLDRQLNRREATFSDEAQAKLKSLASAMDLKFDELRGETKERLKALHEQNIDLRRENQQRFQQLDHMLQTILHQLATVSAAAAPSRTSRSIADTDQPGDDSIVSPIVSVEHQPYVESDPPLSSEVDFEFEHDPTSTADELLSDSVPNSSD